MGPFVGTNIPKPSVKSMWCKCWANTSTEGAFAFGDSNVHTRNVTQIICIGSNAKFAQVKIEY